MSLSVVIPSYKSAATLPRAIRSCLPWIAARNIHVVLDGPDEALEKAASAFEGVCVTVRAERSGAPACRNAGLARVTSDYTMFLDADDYVEGPMLRDAPRVGRNASADLVIGRFHFEGPSGARQRHDPRVEYGVTDNFAILERWLLKRYTPPCAVVWRTDFVRALGGWDETLAKNQDGDLIHRALLADAAVAFSQEGAGVYVQSDDPGRITKQQTPRALASQIRALDKIRFAPRALPDDIVAALALAYYDIARHAYTARIEDLGEKAERTARDLGLNGQPGALVHTVLASMFGLRGKQRLTHQLRRVFLSCLPRASAVAAVKSGI